MGQGEREMAGRVYIPRGVLVLVCLRLGGRVGGDEGGGSQEGDES